MDLLDERGRKPSGGKLEAILRLREPLSGTVCNAVVIVGFPTYILNMKFHLQPIAVCSMQR